MLIALLALTGTARAGEEESIRCPGGIVSRGDLKLDLLGKCGEPTLRELSSAEEVGVVHRAETAGREGSGAVASSRRETSTVERWTYDLGPNQFVRIATLEGGRVRSVTTGGRGYAEERSGERRPLPLATCDYKGLRVGDEAYEVLARCGEPATRDVRLLERALEARGADGETVQRSVTVPIEIWAYHFGPQTLTRVVELEDGKVLRVETGGRGYPR
jgi:hypothetical protein